MKNEKQESPELVILRNEVRVIHERLSAIESSLEDLKINAPAPPESVIETSDEAFDLRLPFQGRSNIEFRVGEYGMAWLGNIVLLFGITFLVQYLQKSGYPVFSVLAGFISILAVYLVAFASCKSYAYLSKLFNYNGHLLLFYFTLRLHFFETIPFIPNQQVALVLLLLVVGVLFFVAWRRQSQLMSSMVLLMLVVTGIVGNSISFLAAMALVVALLSLFLNYRFGWTRLYFVFILVVYLSHLVWLLNNPFMGNNPEFIASPGMNILAVFATGLVFSLIAFFPEKEHFSGEYIIATIVLNGLGFTILLLISTFAFYSKNYDLMYGTIAVFCMIFSVVLKWRSLHKIVASIYVLYGFLALSVAFYGLFLFPKAYMLFSLQSLMVVSIALWFRSRFMIIMNTILFFLFMVFYLRVQPGVTATNFSFMLVAFVSARVINWKKERLKIRTEFVRNLYLVCGFVMTLLAFYSAFPVSYVTVSWIVAALVFFLFSYLINNIKYRWLAIATVVASALKLILVDMADIDIGYRVLVFLLLAIISIAVSVFYTKFFGKKR